MYHKAELSRRSLLRSVAALSATSALLAACQNGQVNTALVGALASDINNIGQALSNDLPALVASKVLAAGPAAQISGAVAKIATLAGSITSASTAATGQSTVQQIETLVNGIVNAAAGLQLPAPFGLAFTAASILLPVLETGLATAIAVAGGGTPPAAAPAPAAPGTMDVPTARLILQQHAAVKPLSKNTLSYQGVPFYF